MDVQKIKRLKNPGNRKPKTKKQIEAARVSMKKIVLSGISHTPEANEKRRLTRIKKGIKPKFQFPKGNKFGALRKNRKISENQKKLLSMKHLGKPCHSEEYKKELSDKFKRDNPMKKEEVREKNSKSMKQTKRRYYYNNPKAKERNTRNLGGYKGKGSKNFIPWKKGQTPWNKGKKMNFDLEIQKKANEKRRIASKTNEKIIATQFCTNKLITPEMEKEICELYKTGYSLEKLGKTFKADKYRTIRKILLNNNIKLRTRNDPVYHLENNFHKKCKEVQDEETNILMPFNPALISN